MTTDLIDRAKSILLKPRDTWPVIDTEPADVASLYTRYYMILAAIPAVCAFIGLSVIGLGGLGLSYRVPLAMGLVNMVVSYVVSLALVYLLALVIDVLAPTFGGTRSRIQALKVAVYASTAMLLGGVFSLLPSLAMLGLLVALYSIYLLYTGLPVLMKSPGERSLPYTAVVVVAAIVISVVLAGAASLFMPNLSMVSAMVGASSNSSSQPEATPAPAPAPVPGVDTSRIEEAARRMQEAASATQSGQTVPVQSLRAAVPETLGGLPRTALEVSDGAALGVAMAQAKAEYRQGDKHATLSIVDAVGLGQLAQLAAVMQTERETETEIEKNHKEGDRVIQESYAKDGSGGEYKVVLKNGVIVSLEGERMSIDEMKKAVNQMDLNALEGLQRAAR